MQETQQTKMNRAETSYEDTLEAVVNEIRRAKEKHGPQNFHNLMEAYAVLKEEVDEMWHEIKHGTKDKAVEEAIQVAAMAVRLAGELGTYPYKTVKPSHDEVTKDLLEKLFIHLNKK